MTEKEKKMRVLFILKMFIPSEETRIPLEEDSSCLKWLITQHSIEIDGVNKCVFVVISVFLLLQMIQREFCSRFNSLRN